MVFKQNNMFKMTMKNYTEDIEKIYIFCLYSEGEHPNCF